MAPMVPGREEGQHSKAGKGGAFPDGLHPGDRSSSFQECVCLVLTA